MAEIKYIFSSYQIKDSILIIQCLHFISTLKLFASLNSIIHRKYKFFKPKVFGSILLPLDGEFVAPIWLLCKSFHLNRFYSFEWIEIYKLVVLHLIDLQRFLVTLVNDTEKKANILFPIINILFAFKTIFVTRYAHTFPKS